MSEELSAKTRANIRVMDVASQIVSNGSQVSELAQSVADAYKTGDIEKADVILRGMFGNAVTLSIAKAVKIVEEEQRNNR